MHLEEVQQKLAKGQAVCFKIKVTPKSGQQKIDKILDDGTIKIKLKSAPEKNKANQELINFLSEYFEVPTRNIVILSGETSPLKIIEITHEP